MNRGCRQPGFLISHMLLKSFLIDDVSSMFLKKIKKNKSAHPSRLNRHTGDLRVKISDLATKLI